MKIKPKECLLVYASPLAKNSGNYWPELQVNRDSIVLNQEFIQPLNENAMSLNEAEETIELRGLSVDLNENAMSLNEAEEEKVPDTPSSVDSLHRLHRKLLLLEKKDSAIEESLDGSVIGDLDGLDLVSTIE
nr:myosin-binding protein 2 [Ipomoea trifida]